MNRNLWLILTLVVLVLGNVVWRIWSNWGLITVKVDGKPLSEVIRSIEKQGGVTIKTNLDGAKPVTMAVEKVELAEALETLAVVTDSRWRLTYVIGPDKGTIASALATISGGQRLEGWRTHYVPMFGLNQDTAVLPDPRRDLWDVQAPKEATLQSYLEQASRNVSASFMVPQTYNPAVTKAPGAGAIRKSLPKLVSRASGKYEEIFYLQGERRDRAEGDGRERRGNDDDGTRFAGNFGDGGGRGGGFNREAMEERMKNEIKKLPPAERAAAEAEQEERRKFFEEMRTLPPEQRAAKMEEFMEDPKNQERMDKAMAARDARQSPQQRMQRGQRYRERKQQSQQAR